MPSVQPSSWETATWLHRLCGRTSLKDLDGLKHVGQPRRGQPQEKAPTKAAAAAEKEAECGHDQQRDRDWERVGARCVGLQGGECSTEQGNCSTGGTDRSRLHAQRGCDRNEGTAPFPERKGYGCAILQTA